MARTLGRSVRELLATLDAAELAEWEAFYAVEPWGEQRRDWQTALLASILANQWRGKGSPARVKDFLPDYWKEPQQPVDRMIAMAKMFAATTQVSP